VCESSSSGQRVVVGNLGPGARIGACARHRVGGRPADMIALSEVDLEVRPGATGHICVPHERPGTPTELYVRRWYTTKRAFERPGEAGGLTLRELNSLSWHVRHPGATVRQLARAFPMTMPAAYAVMQNLADRHLLEQESPRCS